MLEVKSCVATLDTHLLRFDIRKRDDAHGEIGVCIHPMYVVEMLQLWVSSPVLLPDAIADIARMPFMRQASSSDAERVSVQIIAALSRYEKSDEFSADMVGRILANESVRARVAKAESEDERFKMVKDAVVDEQRQEIAAERRRAEQEKDRAELERQLRVQQEAEAEKRSREHSDREEKTQAHAEELHEKLDSTSEELAELKQRVALKEQSEVDAAAVRRKLRHRVWYVVASVASLPVILMAMLSLGNVIVSHSPAAAGWSPMFVNGLMTSICLLGFVMHGWAIGVIGDKSASIRDWPLYGRYIDSRKSLWGLAVQFGINLAAAGVDRWWHPRQ